DADRELLDAGQQLAERLLQSAPASEEAHRALMRIHLRRGRTNAALRQFMQCKEALRREPQADPDLEARQLFEPIRPAGNDGQEKAQEAGLTGPMPANGSASDAAVHPSIAIMPFDNLGDASDAYFADGVVEEITSALSRIRDFFVIARQSTFTFKG